MMSAKGSRLPAEYQEVKWIRSDGQAYIMGPTALESVYRGYIAKIDAVADIAVGRYGIFGYDGGGQVALSNGNISNESVTSSYSWGNRMIVTSRAILNEQYTGIYIDDQLVIQRDHKVAFDQSINTPVGIFCITSKGSFYTYFNVAPATVYSIKIYRPDGITLINDLVPCYRKADNVEGLFDVKNSVFYTNAGSGSFTVGPDV